MTDSMGKKDVGRYNETTDGNEVDRHGAFSMKST